MYYLTITKVHIKHNLTYTKKLVKMIQGNYPEVISGISDNAFEVLVHPKLTKTELEILKRVRMYDKAIADDLHISYHTVTKHWQNIRLKTGYKNTAELTLLAVCLNLITINKQLVN